MSLELVVEDTLLKTKMSVNKDKFSSELSLQQRALEVKYRGGGIQLMDAQTLLEKASLLFAGTYYAVKEKIQNETTSIGSSSASFQRAYSATVASEAVLQYIEENFDGDHETQSITLHAPDVRDDASLISKSIKDLTATIRQTTKLGDCKSAVIEYFSEFKQLAKEKLLSFNDKKALVQARQVSIKGSYFMIRGLEDTIVKTLQEELSQERRSKTDSSFAIRPKIISLSKYVHAEEILGNEKAKSAIYQSVSNLFAYNFAVRKNPFLEDGGFNQTYFLVGDSGSGKTLLMHYAISQAMIFAEKTGKEFEAIDLTFRDAHQDGPVLILKNQLEYISQGDKLFFVAIDDADAMFPGRERLFNAIHRADTGNEMLQFLNGLTYLNRGNYIISFTSNKPFDLDKALRSRLSKGTYYCKGPVTPEQKAKILENNIRSYLNDNFIKATKWEKFGELSQELGLQGRDLRSVAELISENSRTNHFPTNFHTGMTYAAQVQEINKRHVNITNKMVEAAIYEIGNKSQEMQKATKAFERV